MQSKRLQVAAARSSIEAWRWGIRKGGGDDFRGLRINHGHSDLPADPFGGASTSSGEMAISSSHPGPPPRGPGSRHPGNGRHAPHPPGCPPHLAVGSGSGPPDRRPLRGSGRVRRIFEPNLAADPLRRDHSGVRSRTRARGHPKFIDWQHGRLGFETSQGLSRTV